MSGKLFGYARVSTTDQSTEVQREALIKAGVPEALLFAEKASGTSRDGRPELARVLSLLREGDVLVVTRIDRIARSMLDFANILADIKKAGASFKCTEQAIDTSGPTGALTLHILGAVAEFETQLRRERQMEGIAKAKAEGAYTGRKRHVDGNKIRQLRAEGMRPADIRRTLGVSESAVFRALRETAV